MNDDIIRMAREAGFLLVEVHDRGIKGWWECFDDELETLVALARADERNKLAAWMQAQGYATGHGDTIEQLLDELRWQVRESEREACADIAENWNCNGAPRAGVAAQIRARGQA
jgi:hypothetical protein